MKKQLLSIFAALTLGTVTAQTPSPSWAISQNPSFTVAVAGTRYLDAVDANVVWLGGYDGTNSRNYNWYSRTTNGGTSYTSGSVFPDTLTYVMSNMEGIDANTAWVCAFKKVSQNGGVIYRTTNSGASWSNMTQTGMYSSTTSFGNFVTFLTPLIGIANGDPSGTPLEFELWTTANGGTSWTQVPGGNIDNPISGEVAYTNVYCKDGTTNVWFGTSKGRVFHTTDAGQNWTASSIQIGVPTNTIVDVAFSGPLNGLCLVSNAGALDLYKSTDGGNTWTNVSPTPGVLPVNFGTNEISGIPGTTYFASVDNNNNLLSYSVDNGVTWIDWGSVLIPYTTIDFVNAYTAWVGGFQGAPVGNNGIFKYGGVTFNSVFTLPINICKPGSTVTVSPVNTSSGVPPLTFSWTSSPATAVFASPTSSVPVITFSALGTYTITLKVTNANNLSSTSSQIINVLSCGSPTANFSIPSTVCNNSAFTLTNTSTGVPLPTFTITTSATSGATIAPVASTQFVTMKFSAPGTYTITSNASSISGADVKTLSINVLNCAPSTNFYFYIPSPLPPLSSTLLPVPANSVGIATGCVDGGNELAVISATNISTSANGNNTYTWGMVGPVGSNSVTTSPVTYTVTGGTVNKLFQMIKVPGTYTVTLRAVNISGTTTVSKTFDVGICTGIAENNVLANNLMVYPNPAHEQLNIVLPASNESYKIKMINVIGAVVYEEKTVKNSKDMITLNLLNKAKGVYFLSVESSTEKVVKKIVVE